MSEREDDGWVYTEEPATSLHIGPCDSCKALEADLARERERTTALREALERFGRHEDHCTYRWSEATWNPRCSCGYHAALAASSPADTQAQT